MIYNQYICGDCLDLSKDLSKDSINLVLTSPPYAKQRDNLYSSVDENVFPEWFTGVCESFKHALVDNGSILVIIRSHIKDGVISDYVLRTRLELRKAGWKECEEIIWFKPDGPPLGSQKRPRRVWENILWFSKSSDPYINLHACGNTFSTRIGFEGSDRFGDGNVIENSRSKEIKTGTSRVSDVFTAKVSDIENGIMHPAMYPRTLATQLIKTFSKEGDTILDPFAGSGTTLVESARLKRKYLGFDLNKDYKEEFEKRWKRMGLDNDLFYI